MDLNNFFCKVTESYFVSKNDKLVTPAKSVPVKNKIPRFIWGSNYADAFGLQWNTYKLAQFDSYTKTEITEDRLKKSIGRDLSQLKGARVLEAGCGAGRFTEVLLKYGAKVYSFDLSDAVDANMESNGASEDITVFQADITDIPFKDNFFDFVICLGVLQHTPSTERSLCELFRVLRPGGLLVSDHYKYHLGIFTSLYLVWWFVVRSLPPAAQLSVTRGMTNLFFPIHWRFRNVKLVQILLRRVSPINFYYGRFDLPKKTLRLWSELDTHDRNTDHYKRHIRREQYRKILSKFGAKNVEVEVGGTGYIARATK